MIRMLVAGGLLAFVAVAWASERVVVEDWSRVAVGTKGVPPGWAGESWGRRANFDLTVTEAEGRRALQLRSHDERSTITYDLGGPVDLKRTPMLEWTWKVVKLPPGGDARRPETTDQAAQLYVVWPRRPRLVRSRLIGYAWDTGAPAGAIVPSRKTRTVTYVIVRSGERDLGQWVTERRNVRDDYRQIFGEEPEGPGAISLSIDSNDTHSSAESFIGPIVFRGE